MMSKIPGKRKLCIVVGTRPNFIKVTQFRRVVDQSHPDISLKIVHTGQHYDQSMARVFFDQFGLRPDVMLDVEPGHPAIQIGSAIDRLARYFQEDRPDLVIAVGDVNSTLAAALAANKCGIALAHLESGLRSGDRSMPEEHNRRVADLLSDLHFITEDSGLKNLRDEGHPESGLRMVGNTMIDTLVAFKDKIQASDVLDRLQLSESGYMLATIHRPSNVDEGAGLSFCLELFEALTARYTCVFPAHPRTLSRMKDFALHERFEAIEKLHLIQPQSYFDFQKLVAESAFVLTDSGGIQEECTFLQKPCLTLRPNTERPVTITIGSNTLLEFDVADICRKAEQIADGSYKRGEIPPLWDGKATERVMQHVEQFFERAY